LGCNARLSYTEEQECAHAERHGDVYLEPNLTRAQADHIVAIDSRTGFVIDGHGRVLHVEAMSKGDLQWMVAAIVEACASRGLAAVSSSCMGALAHEPGTALPDRFPVVSTYQSVALDKEHLGSVFRNEIILENHNSAATLSLVCLRNCKTNEGSVGLGLAAHGRHFYPITRTAITASDMRTQMSASLPCETEV
jgi:hypothetical protein